MTGSRALYPLGLARAAFGVVFLLRTTPLLAPLDPPFLRGMGPLLGWPDGLWHASVLGLSLPDAVVAVLCLVRTVAAASLALGVATRGAGIAAGALGYAVLAQDAFGYFHHLHLLFLGAILLGLVDSGCTFALRPAPARSPRSSVLVVWAFVASVYVWAGLGKLRPDWLDGRALALFHEQGALQGALADALLETQSRRAAVAWIVALVEIALAPALLLRRTRFVALGVALAMHAAFEVVGRVDSIGWQMAALLTSFLPTGRNAPPGPAPR